MNYTDIINAAIAYADRQDIEVANNIGTFVTMAESRINRVLKTREQSHRAFSPIVEDQSYYSLPPDYRGMRDIQLNSDVPYVSHNVGTYSYINPQQMNKLTTESGLFYTVIANQIQIHPLQASGQTLEVVYYRKVPNLNSDNASNWLSEEHPDIYIAGIISQIEAFVKNYDVSKAWDERMTRCIAELDKSDVDEVWSGAPLQIRIS